MSCEGLSLFVSVYGIAWNVLITNYVEQEQIEEALKWFISMSYEGLSLDATTFVLINGIAWNVSIE